MAKKSCPQCDTSCGPATRKCPNCDHDFKSGSSEKSEKIEEPINQGKKPSFLQLDGEKRAELKVEENFNKKITPQGTRGPGKKQCQGCKSYVGVKSKKCEYCGEPFGEKSKTASSDNSSDEKTSKKKKRNCVNCEKEYESEDYRVDEYGKITYIWKSGRYCSFTCMERGDEVKSEIIIYLFNRLPLGPDWEAGISNQNILKELNKREGIESIMKSVFDDYKEEEEDKEYKRTHPIIINHSSKKKLSHKECEDLGMLPEKIRQNEEPKRKSLLDLEEDDE